MVGLFVSVAPRPEVYRIAQSFEATHNAIRRLACLHHDDDRGTKSCAMTSLLARNDRDVPFLEDEAIVGEPKEIFRALFIICLEAIDGHTPVLLLLPRTAITLPLLPLPLYRYYLYLYLYCGATDLTTPTPNLICHHFPAGTIAAATTTSTSYYYCFLRHCSFFLRNSDRPRCQCYYLALHDDDDDDDDDDDA